MSQVARDSFGISPQALSQRVRPLLEARVAAPTRCEWPSGALILLADGLWFRFGRQFWVLYLTAVRGLTERHATFVDPTLLPGRESAHHWTQVFDALPVELRSRVCAVVTDDLRGMPNVAAARGWVLQLCHFHLISQLQGRRGRRQTTVTHRPHREELYQLVRQALVVPAGPMLDRPLRAIRRRLAQRRAIGRMRGIVLEFLRRLDLYRSYQRFPAWHLPTTTGAVEAMAHRLRSHIRRLGNLRTPDALYLWATLAIRLRPTITCNGKRNQPNSLV